MSIVAGDVQQASEAGWEIQDSYTMMRDLKLEGMYFSSADNPDQAEFVVPVKWENAVPVEEAVRETGFFGNQNTVCRPTSEKWNFTVKRLKELWHIQD